MFYGSLCGENFNRTKILADDKEAHAHTPTQITEIVIGAYLIDNNVLFAYATKICMMLLSTRWAGGSVSRNFYHDYPRQGWRTIVNPLHPMCPFWYNDAVLKLAYWCKKQSTHSPNMSDAWHWMEKQEFREQQSSTAAKNIFGFSQQPSLEKWWEAKNIQLQTYDRVRRSSLFTRINMQLPILFELSFLTSVRPALSLMHESGKCTKY